MPAPDAPRRPRDAVTSGSLLETVVPQYPPMAAPRIAVVGSTTPDLIPYPPRRPGPGETLVGDRFQMGFGGKGANQAVMARLLGAEVTMVNCVGDDAYGPLTRSHLGGFGVDVTPVYPVPGASGVAPIGVEPGGTNRIIIIPGANDHLTPAQATAAVTGLPSLDVGIGQFEIPQQVTIAAFAAARCPSSIPPRERRSLPACSPSATGSSPTRSNWAKSSMGRPAPTMTSSS